MGRDVRSPFQMSEMKSFRACSYTLAITRGMKFSGGVEPTDVPEVAPVQSWGGPTLPTDGILGWSWGQHQPNVGRGHSKFGQIEDRVSWLVQPQPVFKFLFTFLLCSIEKGP